MKRRTSQPLATSLFGRRNPWRFCRAPGSPSSVFALGSPVYGVLLLVLFAVSSPQGAFGQDGSSSSAENSFPSRCNPCVGLEASTATNGDQWLTGVSSSSTPTVSSTAETSKLFVYVPGNVEPTAAADLRAELILDIEIATPAPLTTNAQLLQSELTRLSARLERSTDEPRVRLRWTGGSPTTSPADWNFLIKRTAVAVTGARPDAKLLIGFEDPDVAELQALIDEELAAYIDGIAFKTGTLDAAAIEAFSSFREALAVADPDSELVFLGLQVDDDPNSILADAARVAQIGGQIAVFDFGDQATADAAAPLRLWAREFAGDITFDPYSSPTGANAWSFVRGEDLALRVVVEKPGPDSVVDLTFTDRSLTTPMLLSPGQEPQSLFGGRRTRQGYRLDIRPEEVPAAFLVAMERQGLGPLEGVEGVEERVDVEDSRQMPVAEILRRLQATEDAQNRRLTNFSAINSTSLRFLLGNAQSLDATFKGPFFFRADGGYDWAWDEFFVNGVRWRRKKIPEIPLIQPEKATAQPVDISFNKDYSYRLRGTANVEGRDTWVVDFQPAIKPEPGRTLYQGTVWVDREFYVRVKTNAVQLGLTGDVIANEETTFYQPLNAAGDEVPWSRDAYVIGTKVVGQQIFSVLSGTTVVEREVLLTNLEFNPADFAARRQAKLASDATMVRDTDNGMRYLVVDDEGNRVVKEEFDKSRLFLVGGVFYDEAQDYPLPLAGLNWLNFDFKGTGIQTNVFFAGPLLIADVSDPSLFGSRWNFGVDAFALAIAGEDKLTVNDQELEEQTIKSSRPNIDFTLGRPVGQFFKLSLDYSLGFNNFSRADDTAEEFVLPEDHIDHRLQLTGAYNRKGYRLRLRGSHNIRSDWENWGLPDNTEFNPDHEEYQRWSGSVRKVWHLPKFTKFGAEIEYAGGENLDRFSKYQFGFFSDLVIRGYSSDSVRAEEVTAAHLSYGFNLADVFRVDLVADAALASDEFTGMEDELLAGIGLNGTVIGPWGTIVNFDIGFPVAGPQDGFTAYIAFLKLYNR